MGRRKVWNRYERSVERALQIKGVSQILSKKDRTTKEDLYRIWNQITAGSGPELLIQWDYNYDKKTMWNKPVILNLGNPLQMGGTHWIAVYGDKFFDSYGLPPPVGLYLGGWDGEWEDRQIQGLYNGNCGQYCILWLNSILTGGKNFYNSFG